MTVWGQPLRVQRSMKTQTQPPTGVRRALQPRFLRRQTASENSALRNEATGPRKAQAARGGARYWGGAREEVSLEARGKGPSGNQQTSLCRASG